MIFVVSTSQNIALCRAQDTRARDHQTAGPQPQPQARDHGQTAGPQPQPQADSGQTPAVAQLFHYSCSLGVWPFSVWVQRVCIHGCRIINISSRASKTGHPRNPSPSGSGSQTLATISNLQCQVHVLRLVMLVFSCGCLSFCVCV